MHAELLRDNVRNVIVVFHVLVIIKKHIPAIIVFDGLIDHASLAEAGIGWVQNTHLAARLILGASSELGDGFVDLIGLIHHLDNLGLLLHDPVLHDLAVYL